MKLSNDEWILLSHLRNDARKSLVKIADETNMPLSTVYEKLRQFERDFIKKHTCIVDFKKLGYIVRINMVLKVKKDQREKLHDYLVNEKRINSIYRVNSNNDFMVECLFKDYKEYKEFNEEIDEKFAIENKHVFHLIEDVKEEGFLAIND